VASHDFPCCRSPAERGQTCALDFAQGDVAVVAHGACNQAVVRVDEAEIEVQIEEPHGAVGEGRVTCWRGLRSPR